MARYQITYVSGAVEEIRSTLADRLAVEADGHGAIEEISSLPMSYGARVAYAASKRLGNGSTPDYAEWLASVEDFELLDEQTNPTGPAATAG